MTRLWVLEFKVGNKSYYVAPAHRPPVERRDGAQRWETKAAAEAYKKEFPRYVIFEPAEYPFDLNKENRAMGSGY